MIGEAHFLILRHFIWSDLKVDCPTIKLRFSVLLMKKLQLNLHMHVSPTHPYTIISISLSVDLHSCGSVKKYAGASFFTDTPSRQNISNKTSVINSCRYLNPRSSLQWMACSTNISKYTLRKIGKTSSIGNKGIINWYLRMVWYSTRDIC